MICKHFTSLERTRVSFQAKDSEISKGYSVEITEHSWLEADALDSIEGVEAEVSPRKCHLSKRRRWFEPAAGQYPPISTLNFFNTRLFLQLRESSPSLTTRRAGREK